MPRMADDPLVRALDEALTRAEKADAELHVEIMGLRYARDRRLRELGIQDTSRRAHSVVSSQVAEWRELPRTEAVVRMLRIAGGQLHRKELTDRLNAVGRDDSIEAVSAALAYLAREPNARVAAMGRGMWQLMPPIFDSGPAGDAIREAHARGEAPEDDGFGGEAPGAHDARRAQMDALPPTQGGASG